MHLASIVPPASCHHADYMQITVTMPGAEAHRIVHSEDSIHMIINSFTNLTLANANGGLILEATLRSIC